MAEKKKLGGILKDSGLIDDFQLQAALSHQRNWGGKLGSVVIELGFVREADLARVLSETLRLPYSDLFEPEIPEAALKLIKPEIARNYLVMPVKKEGNALTLAMSDPLDIDAIDAIRFATGLNIKPTLALVSEINDAIRKYYDHEDIKRTKQPVVLNKPSAPGKMEIIRGSDFSSGQQKVTAIGGDLLRQEQPDEKLRLDALISLLLEKEIITRDELVKMIYQKKIGL